MAKTEAVDYRERSRGNSKSYTSKITNDYIVLIARITWENNL